MVITLFPIHLIHLLSPDLLLYDLELKLRPINKLSIINAELNRIPVSHANWSY